MGLRAVRGLALVICVVAACAQRGDQPGAPSFDDAGAREAWEQTLSGGSIAPDYLQQKQQALSSAQRRARMEAASATAPQWRSIGPFDLRGYVGSAAGRLRAVVPHPRDPHVIYIATAGGGVWKTTDADPRGGSVWTWKALTDALPAASASGNIAVGGLAMDRADPETLYLALGDPFQDGGALGFFISHDGGATWSAGNVPPVVSSVFTVYSPAAGTVLIGSTGGLWRSVDGGVSFALAQTGGLTSIYSIAEFADGTLVCSAGSGLRVLDTVLLFSTDAGGTWTRSSMPQMKIGRATIATSGSAGWAMVADSTELLDGTLHSTDSGRTWSWVAGTILDKGQGWYNQAIAVDPDDPARVAIGGREALSSEDAGHTWVYLALTHPDLQTATWWTAAPKRLLLGHDGGLTVVTDPWNPYGRSSDSSHNAGVASQLAYNLSSSVAPGANGERDRVALGLQDNGCVLGTASTGRFDVAVGGDGFGVLLHPLDATQGLCGVNGTIWRIDGGSASLLEVRDLQFGVQLFPDESDPSGDSAYALASHAIYRTTDFGRTWSVLGTAGWPTEFVPEAFASSKSRPGTLFAMSGLTGVLSRDGGTTWTKVSSPRGHAGIHSAWIEDDTLYIASPLRDTASNHLWKSNDRGATWQAIDAGLPPLPVWKIRADPGAGWVLWAATDVGVYRSGDAGRSWARFGTGLPWVTVRDLYVAPDDSVLRVATYGRGVWEVAIAKPEEPPPPAAPASTRQEASGGGCSSASHANFGVLVLVAWLVRRRRRSGA
jgi:hypothetical protein